jgi:CheY-like chemotaxis protein
VKNGLIIIVEDDPSLLKLQSKILRLEGYETLALNRATGAYDRILEAQPNLVLLDMQMEHPRSGLQVIRQIRADVRTEHIPILLCCGGMYLSDVDCSDLKQSKVAIVVKPVSPNILLQKIATLLHAQ